MKVQLNQWFWALVLGYIYIARYVRNFCDGLEKKKRERKENLWEVFNGLFPLRS